MNVTPVTDRAPESRPLEPNQAAAAPACATCRAWSPGADGLGAAVAWCAERREVMERDERCRRYAPRSGRETAAPASLPAAPESGPQTGSQADPRQLAFGF